MLGALPPALTPSDEAARTGAEPLEKRLAMLERRCEGQECL